MGEPDGLPSMGSHKSDTTEVTERMHTHVRGYHPVMMPLGSSDPAQRGMQKEDL